MQYGWLVIWWVITVTQGSCRTSSGVFLSEGSTLGIANSQHLSIEEKHKKTTMNFVLFKTKAEAEQFVAKPNLYGYDGNTKLKFQIVELQPGIGLQRPDASEEQKELLKDE